MATLRRLGNICGGLVLVSVLVASCGTAFHVGEGDAAAGAPSAEAGSGGEASSGAPAALGGAAGAAGAENGKGGVDGGAGGAPGGAGGAVGVESSCELLGGEVYGEHCYVDVTAGTVTQPVAAAACEALGAGAHLLVLDTLAEQDFILTRFMRAYQDVSDAWLGLTCSAQSHPDVADCHCEDCSTEQLAEKQAAWSWSDGTSATFGWVNGNPNATVRCAALGYNPSADIESWGWVDRACNLDKVTPVPQHPHTYRTICELE